MEIFCKHSSCNNASNFYELHSQYLEQLSDSFPKFSYLLYTFKRFSTFTNHLPHIDRVHKLLSNLEKVASLYNCRLPISPKSSSLLERIFHEIGRRYLLSLPSHKCNEGNPTYLSSKPKTIKPKKSNDFPLLKTVRPWASSSGV